MTTHERHYLAVGMTIKKMPRVCKQYNPLADLTKIERILWLNEKAKQSGWKIFSAREIEKLTKLNKEYIKKLIAKMVEKGHLG